MRRLRAYLRLLRARDARARRVLEVAGRSFIERRTENQLRSETRGRAWRNGDFSDAWLARTKAAR